MAKAGILHEDDRVELIEGEMIEMAAIGSKYAPGVTGLIEPFGAKMPLYAAAGIPEAWIVNIPRRTLEVYRESRGGRYQEMTVNDRGTSITLLVLQDVAFPVEAFIA